MDPKQFTVGWICALPKSELTAAWAMLDEEYEDLDQEDGDSNLYTYGRIGPHNVVIACLPAGRYGTASATGVAQNMLRTFPNIEYRLMVGIGGGLPNAEDDVRLGDVVVSQPAKGHGGVVQYDLGKVSEGGKFQTKMHLDAPPTILLNAVGKLQSRHVRKAPEFVDYVSQVLRQNSKMTKPFARPNAKLDQLSSGVASRLDPTAASPEAVEREPREEPMPHYGLIASGNEVVASYEEAQRIQQLVGGADTIICFEMEAAGLANDFRPVVVRGICDYADSLKNDHWQKYAALTAAAYAKELLYSIPGSGTTRAAGASGKASGKASGQAPTPRDGTVFQGTNNFNNTSADNGKIYQGTFSGATFN